jgi:hypothetical protein
MLGVLKKGKYMYKSCCMLMSVFCLFASLASAQTNEVSLEVDADFLMVQMKYQEADAIYSQIDDTNDAFNLKIGVARYLYENYEGALEILLPLTNSEDQNISDEALFYCLSAKIAIADQGDIFLFLDDDNVKYAKEVLTNLDTVESKAFKELLMSQILEHLLSRKDSNTQDALLSTIELVDEQLKLMDQNDPRTQMLWVKFGYLQKNYNLVNKAAAQLLDSGVDIEMDPFLYPFYSYLSKSMYDRGQVKNVILEDSGFVSECSTRADTALYYGVEYLRMCPYDEEFADWLAGKVLMSLFMQTSNPGYLVDILQVGHPTGTELDGLHKLARGVLRAGEEKNVFAKADSELAQSVFSSEYWNRRGRVELMSQNLSDIEEYSLSDDELKSIKTLQMSSVPVLIGGAMLMQNKQDFIDSKILLHNKTQGGFWLKNHTSLSELLFNNDMKVLHSYIDKQAGRGHRIKSGHDLKWLAENLYKLANQTLPDGTKVGRMRAILVWNQHMGQDFFSTDGIPTPLTRPARQFAVWYRGKFKHKFLNMTSLQLASKTTINATTVMNIAGLVYIIYEINDACQDFFSGRDVKNIKQDVQESMFYGDLLSSCDNVEDALSEERITKKRPAASLALQITLARMYAMNGDLANAEKNLKDAVTTCQEITKEFKDGVDIGGNTSSEYQAEHMDKLSRILKIVLIHDAIFNAQISCEGFAYEAWLLSCDEDKQTSYLNESIGRYERTGDNLAKYMSVWKGKQVVDKSLSRGRSIEMSDVDMSWSAAVNYYRAARLAQEYNHDHFERLRNKAVDMLFEMRKDSGILTRPLMDKLRKSWMIEFGMNEQAESMADIRIYRDAIPKNISWKELKLSNLTISPKLLEKESDLVIELVHRDNDIESTLFRERLDDVQPGKSMVMLNRWPISIANNEEYELRIYKPGMGTGDRTIWDKEIYSSDDWKAHSTKGISSLAAALANNKNINIKAELVPAKPVLLNISGLRLSKQAGSVCEDKKGIAVVSLAGREPIVLDKCYFGEDGKMSRQGMNLDKAKDKLTATGFPPVLLYQTKSNDLDINIRQISSLVKLKAVDLDDLVKMPLGMWWLALSPVAFGSTSESLVSFDVSDMSSEERALTFSVDGSCLEYSKKIVTPIKGVTDK